jgi:hypothetical protein
MKIRPIFAWFDFWIGLFWDRKKRWLYILPVPCFGVVVQFPLARVPGLYALNISGDTGSSDSAPMPEGGK